MDWVIWVILAVMFLFIAWVVYLCYKDTESKAMLIKSDADDDSVGHLIIDPSDFENGGGIYLQLDVDPSVFKDEASVKLKIWLVNSHEKQAP